MLRVAEKWQGSDVGRQRAGNEDNYFAEAPLFVVADGMGGAQAGEVASELAVEAFRGGLPAGPTVDALVATIRGANGKIVAAAKEDTNLHGMGTTCTAAYVAEEEVILAHVGDSRCYLMRNGELARLTHDHSLVDELIRRGKLTEEEAEVHPQRSVITRALGAEADVQVDTERVSARHGDVFLLCSDGLTGMVREPQVKRILNEAPALEAAGRNLIAAANAAGGRDNITVILFRLETVDLSHPSTDDGATTSLPVIAEPPPVEESAPPPRTAPLPASPRDKTSAGPAGRWRRIRAPLLVTLILLAVFAGCFWIAMRAVFFVGTNAQQAVTIYRGLPYDLPLGIELYTRNYTSGVTLEQVPESRRETFTDHKLRSLGDAEDLVRQLETGTLKE